MISCCKLYLKDFDKALLLALRCFQSVKVELEFTNPTYFREYVLTYHDFQIESDIYVALMDDASRRCCVGASIYPR